MGTKTVELACAHPYKKGAMTAASQTHEVGLLCESRPYLQKNDEAERPWPL